MNFSLKDLDPAGRRWINGVVVVVVVLLLTAKSHTNRSHVSNIFTCVVIYSQTCLSSARNMTFSYRRHNETKNS